MCQSHLLEALSRSTHTLSCRALAEPRKPLQGPSASEPTVGTNTACSQISGSADIQARAHIGRGHSEHREGTQVHKQRTAHLSNQHPPHAWQEHPTPKHSCFRRGSFM